MPRPRRLLAAASAILLVAGLSACSTTVSLQPADAANDPACADISVRLPGSIAGEERRWTDAQSTAAWGDPSAVLFTCGVTPPGPTEAQCITLGGVDWIVDESAAPQYRVTSYGRTPAVELYIDNGQVSSNDVLSTIGTVVSGQIEAERQCVSTESLLP